MLASCLAFILSAVLLILTPLPASGAPDQPPAAASIPASRSAANVAVITIDRQIDATMVRSVKRRIAAAARDGADAIVFELDCPGGELGAVFELCNLIKTSPIPNTVAWVHNAAYSGGAIAALACREIVVSEVARLGDAAVIGVIQGPGGARIHSLGETERQKLTVPILTELVDSARRRGYDEKLVQGLVTRGVELWLVENARTGQRLFIDREEHRLLFGEPPDTEPFALASAAGGPSATRPSNAGDKLPQDAAQAPNQSDTPGAPTVPKASPAAQAGAIADASSTRPVLTEADRGQWRKLEKVSDGNGIFTFTERQLLSYGLASKTIRNDQELKAFFGAANLVRLNESWSERMVVYLNTQVAKGILLVIFFVCFFIEMTHPGVVLPGIAAAAALILLIVAPSLNNMASWWEIASILVGIVLLALEFFVIPGFGVTGILGLILLLVGLVGLFVGDAGALFPNTPRRQSELLSGVTTLFLSVATSGLIIYFLAKHFGSIPILGRLILKDEPIPDGAGLLAAMDPRDGSGVAIGDTGITITPLRPAGRVQVGDRILDVVSDLGFVDAGKNVRVASLARFRITVEPIAGDAVPHRDAPPLRRPAEHLMESSSYLFWGICLLCAAILLVFLEFFLPSAGLVSLLSLVLAIAAIVCLFQVSVTWGITGALVYLVLGVGTFMFALRVMPSTKIGRRLLHGDDADLHTEDGDPLAPLADPRAALLALVGQEGLCLTDLRPVGTIRLGEKKHQARSEINLIPAGTRVRVTAVENAILLVRVA